MTTDLKTYMEEKRRKVDAFLDRHFQIPPEKNRLGQLCEAMRYSLLAGGKRVRPVLCLAAFEACNGSEAAQGAALGVASALEFIHTYSLIHDDLPAMDNDDLRRGRPTNHKVYGEAMAILAGDSLLTEAFALMAGLKGAPAEVLLEVMGDIAAASGWQGMAGGQVIDLESEKRKISPEELEVLHRHKTGCLIQVSVTSGAKLAGVASGKLAAIRKYGENIGLAFQIADDILDVEGGAQEMGKATGGDARKEKSTYPSIMGLDRSKKMAAELAEKSLASLSSFDHRADPLREIASYIVSRRS